MAPVVAYLAFQVPHATVQGFALAAMRMHVIALWPLVLLHAGSNLLVLAETPNAVPWWWEAGQLLLTLALGRWLVRLHESQTPTVTKLRLPLLQGPTPSDDNKTRVPPKHGQR